LSEAWAAVWKECRDNQGSFEWRRMSGRSSFKENEKNMNKIREALKNMRELNYDDSLRIQHLLCMYFPELLMDWAKSAIKIKNR
jgi:hypothetical protein